MIVEAFYALVFFMSLVVELMPTFDTSSLLLKINLAWITVGSSIAIYGLSPVILLSGLLFLVVYLSVKYYANRRPKTPPTSACI
jgi:hypothetical protein